MLFSNRDDVKDDIMLGEHLKDLTNAASTVEIAVGYVSSETVRGFEKPFVDATARGAIVRLLVGTAFFEGLPKNTRASLDRLNSELQSYSLNSGVFVPYARKYHGKIYTFRTDGWQRAFVGSANFSPSGLQTNLECTVEIGETNIKTKVLDYIDYLFSPSISTVINKAKVPHRGIKIPRVSILERTETRYYNLDSMPYFEIDMSAVAEKPKSNLNTYFGKGRVDRKTGIVAPRPWYEVEIICGKELTSNSLYPKGSFKLITADGFEIPMQTNGDYYKNMRSTGTSKGALRVFGQWIKGKLEDSGALTQLSPITPETFEVYGKTSMRLYKIDEHTYYTDF